MKAILFSALTTSLLFSCAHKPTGPIGDPKFAANTCIGFQSDEKTARALQVQLTWENWEKKEIIVGTETESDRAVHLIALFFEHSGKYYLRAYKLEEDKKLVYEDEIKNFLQTQSTSTLASDVGPTWPQEWKFKKAIGDKKWVFDQPLTDCSSNLCFEAQIIPAAEVHNQNEKICDNINQKFDERIEPKIKKDK